MSKEKNIIKYYVLCNKLKDIIRTGWLNWNIERKRAESVAEHIYSVQMLAIAMHSEYQYDIDLMKVILMLAIHELEEIIIGDIPMDSKEHKNKKEKGHQAIKKVLESLLEKDKLESLILEFDERKTKEALFAYHCDKLDCDLQAKLYDEEGCFDLTKQENNERYNSEAIQTLVKNGATTFSEIWFSGDEKLYQDDQNFLDVFTYARGNNIKLK